jgi:hypothetical protein
MNELTSSEFRKRFAKLTEETLVTANGHLIGIWTPQAVTEDFLHYINPPTGDTRMPAPLDPTLWSQARRDKLLNKINKG